MNRVKIFERRTVIDLEEDVNEFLELSEQKPSFKLIDVKFNSYACGEDATDFHSAMIIYEL